MLMFGVVVKKIRTHYLDASAIVKLLVPESASNQIRHYCDQHSVFATTGLCFAETLGVLKMKCLRSELTQSNYLAACDELMAYIRANQLQIEDVGIANSETFLEVEDLAKKHQLDVSDAYQLVTLRKGFFSQFDGDSKPILITADDALATAARKEGIRVWDCLRESAPSVLPH